MLDEASLTAIGSGPSSGGIIIYPRFINTFCTCKLSLVDSFLSRIQTMRTIFIACLLSSISAEKRIDDCIKLEERLMKFDGSLGYVGLLNNLKTLQSAMIQVNCK